MAKDKTNKERLICIEKQQIETNSKIDSLINGFNNHLEHHKRLYDRLFRIFLVVLGIVGTATATVILSYVL